MTEELDARLVEAEAEDGSPVGEELAPSSTWTYLVNDDPFRDQLGRS